MFLSCHIQKRFLFRFFSFSGFPGFLFFRFSVSGVLLPLLQRAIFVFLLPVVHVQSGFFLSRPGFPGFPGW